MAIWKVVQNVEVEVGEDIVEDAKLIKTLLHPVPEKKEDVQPLVFHQPDSDAEDVDGDGASGGPGRPAMEADPQVED